MGLPGRSSTPIWLVSSKYISPLIAAYDERVKEKDEKLKLLKVKIDDLTSKFRMILEENNKLHLRCERVAACTAAEHSSVDTNEL
jgi:centrosomal protein CEP89